MRPWSFPGNDDEDDGDDDDDDDDDDDEAMMVISRFVELNLMWWGGEKELMNNLGDDKTVR